MSGPPDTEPICENCIWHHDWEGLLRTGPCSPTSWAGSIRQTLAEHGNYPDISAPPHALPVFPFCAAVMMVKNEADIIGANLRWLYHSGVRRFIVMDNGSTDGTADALRDFAASRPDARLEALLDPIVAYFQAEKTSWMCERARQIWPDIRWILPIDADEFLIVRRGLHALAYVPDDIHALTVPKAMHFHPAGTEPPDDGRLHLERMSVRSHLFAVPPKVLLRAVPGLGVGSGNHKAVRADGGLVAYAGGWEHGFAYREFQTRSFAQFTSKVRNGGAAIQAGRAQGYSGGGEHWLAWYEVLCSGDEAAFRALYDDVAHRRVSQGYIDDPFTAYGIATSL